MCFAHQLDLHVCRSVHYHVFCWMDFNHLRSSPSIGQFYVVIYQVAISISLPSSFSTMSSQIHVECSQSSMSVPSCNAQPHIHDPFMFPFCLSNLRSGFSTLHFSSLSHLVSNLSSLSLVVVTNL